MPVDAPADRSEPLGPVCCNFRLSPTRCVRPGLWKWPLICECSAPARVRGNGALFPPGALLAAAEALEAAEAAEALLAVVAAPAGDCGTALRSMPPVAWFARRRDCEPGLRPVDEAFEVLLSSKPTPGPPKRPALAAGCPALCRFCRM